MNSIHDMGGMAGMGPIEPELDEPVFHQAWERRVFALSMTISLGRSFRFELENIPAADYLRMSYYERWFTILVNGVLRNNLATPAELESGEADPNLPRPAPPLASIGALPESERPGVPVSPLFRPQQRVRARNIHARGHIRLPRYTRGKRGTVIRDHGIFALQDTDEGGNKLGDRRQHVYTVQFSARELWGDRGVARDTVYVDLWEDYLEPA